MRRLKNCSGKSEPSSLSSLTGASGLPVEGEVFICDVHIS